jgi:hypothetical protein
MKTRGSNALVIAPASLACVLAWIMFQHTRVGLRSGR